MGIGNTMLISNNDRFGVAGRFVSSSSSFTSLLMASTSDSLRTH